MATNNMWNTPIPVPVASGGTSTNTLSAHSVLLGNGTNAVQNVGTGATGQILVGNTSNAPAFHDATAGTGISLTSNASTFQYGLSSPVSVSNGGTGETSLTPYAVICGGTTTTGVLQQVSGVGTSGQVLSSTGTGIPIWRNSSAAGSIVLIETQTVTTVGTTSDIIFSTFDPSSPDYIIVVSNAGGRYSSDTLPGYTMYWSTDSGSTYLSSNYTCGVTAFPTNSYSSTYNSTTDILLFAGSYPPNIATRYGRGSVIWIYNLNNSKIPSFNAISSGVGGSPYDSMYVSYGSNTTTSGINTIKFSSPPGTTFYPSSSISLYKIIS